MSAEWRVRLSESQVFEDLLQAGFLDEDGFMTTGLEMPGSEEGSAMLRDAPRVCQACSRTTSWLVSLQGTSSSSLDKRSPLSELEPWPIPRRKCQIEQEYLGEHRILDFRVSSHRHRHRQVEPAVKQRP